MIKSKKVKAVVCGLLLMMGICLSGSADAEICTVKAVGYYQMGDGMEESQAIAKERAKVDALRRASEQGAVYVESVSKVSQGVLTSDDIKMLTATILQVTDEKYQPVIVGDSIQYQCHLVAVVDTDSVKDKIRNGRLELEDSLRKYQKENERLSREMDNLRQQYKVASETVKQKLRLAEQKNNREFMANQYAKKGYDLQEKKDFNGAIAAYSKAIELNPDYMEVYNNMGNAYFAIGQMEKAIALYEKVIVLRPDCAEAYNNMGMAYVHLGKSKKAISLFEKALVFKPTAEQIYLNMGDAYAALEQYENALKQYENAVIKNPACSKAYCNMGAIYFLLRQYEKAKNNYEKAITLKPDYVEAYSGLGNAYVGLGKFEEAIHQYEKVVMLKPDDAENYYIMGSVYAGLLGNMKKALVCYQKAYRLEPANAEYKKAATGK